MSMPACSCMPIMCRTASSMRRCQRSSWAPVREPDANRSLRYCGRGMLPTTVVGKSKGGVMVAVSSAVDERASRSALDPNVRLLGRLLLWRSWRDGWLAIEGPVRVDEQPHGGGGQEHGGVDRHQDVPAERPEDEGADDRLQVVPGV